MLDDEHGDEVNLQELQEKLESLEDRLEEIAEQAEGSEDEGVIDFVQLSTGKKDFFLHWISINDTNFESCDDVDSVQKAIQAFREADENRSDQQQPFLHGDLIVLLCNSAKEEEESGGAPTYPDSCYYIGMCIMTGDGDVHLEDPEPDLKLSEKFGGKHFIAWSTCGGGLREDYWKISVKACVNGESKDIDILTTTEPDPDEKGNIPEPAGYIFKNAEIDHL